MGKFIKIENKNILKTLEATTRLYFGGNLSKPQIISFIKVVRLEIWISSYLISNKCA